MENYIKEKEELLSGVDKLIIGRTRLEQALQTYRGGEKYRKGFSKAEIKVILDLIPKLWALAVKYGINDTKISSDITRKIKNTGSNNAGRQVNTTHKSLPNEETETKISEDKLLTKYIDADKATELKDKIERQKIEKKKLNDEIQRKEEIARLEEAKKLEKARVLEERKKLEQLRELQERMRLEEIRKIEEAKIQEEVKKQEEIMKNIEEAKLQEEVKKQEKIRKINEEKIREQAKKIVQERMRLEEAKKLEEAIKLEEKMMIEEPKKLEKIGLENAKKLEQIFRSNAKVKLELAKIPEPNNVPELPPPSYNSINNIPPTISQIKVEDQLEKAFHQMFPQKHRFDKYYTIFQSQDIDWSIFTDIDDKILVDIGITLLGPRYKIMKKIHNIKNNIKDVSFYPDTELRNAFHDIFPDPTSFNAYYNLFRDQEIDYDIFLDMTDKDLINIGINLLGPRMKIKKKISQLNGSK